MTNKELMRRAIELSKQSVRNGGGPFGAVIARNGEVIAEGLKDEDGITWQILSIHKNLTQEDVDAFNAKYRKNDNLLPCPVIALAKCIDDVRSPVIPYWEAQIDCIVLIPVFHGALYRNILLSDLFPVTTG